MKPAPFDYARPATLDEACRLSAAPGAMPLAGGQSLVPLMALRKARPARVVDLGGLAALRGIAVADDGSVRIGALVTHAALQDWDAAGPVANFVRKVAGGIGFRSVRNLGTIGGSLAHADPRADWICALLALGGEVEVAGPHGARRVPVADFVLGPSRTALAPGELIGAVMIPAAAPTLTLAFDKLRPKVGAFAELLTAAAFDPATGRARVSLAAAGARPCLLPALGAALARGEAGERCAIEAGLAADTTLDPIDRRRAAALIARNLRRLGGDHAS